uniref:JAB domain-containing protein n=1 Tax=uncultured Sphingomonas sp. TaxID=158754 RepID=UPI0035CBBBA5
MASQFSCLGPDDGDPLHAARALFAPIATASFEVAAFAYLDPEWRLLGMRHVRSNRCDAVMIPVRAVVADALAFDCVAVVMAHNHPSGDPSPSAADFALTRRLARGLDLVEVRLVEHLILARDGCESFRAQGLL